MSINDKRMTKSKEDYLKAILELSACNDLIHSNEIAEKLNITRASVSRMLGILNNSGYITKKKYGTVDLTDKGRKFAEQVQKRHDLIRYFLTDVLSVSNETADLDACRMEHAISKETVDKLHNKLESLIDCTKLHKCETQRTEV
ncbi:MAG: hypothetical protein A2Y17_01070 [Clostridiales bacterium GWF2_38_85]|nr:MAG: hypothetical protein A2Y17_01070 [Clostridiales bacterium GWF2_38_85]HBL84520.1 metal-dependent transcriptional regulator [Clostridiales bacterium]